MIKPRYIRSLTFLLLCDVALWDRRRLSGGPERLPLSFLLLLCFWSFVNLRYFIKTETKEKRKRGRMFFVVVFLRLQLVK